jgi:CheY-like chemotaxis protein
MLYQKPPLRVILIDDDEGDRLIFGEILEELDSNAIVEIMKGGEQLLKALTDDMTPLPHIIFLDLNMPNMNGLECLKEIRINKRYKDITIAIYSTSTSENDINQTFLEGANIYITKPGNYNELKAVLSKALMITRLNQDKTFDRSNFILKI